MSGASAAFCGLLCVKLFSQLVGRLSQLFGFSFDLFGIISLKSLLESLDLTFDISLQLCIHLVARSRMTLRGVDEVSALLRVLNEFLLLAYLRQREPRRP